MATPVMCWRCNSRHWTTQPCKAIEVKVRPMVAEFLSGRPVSGAVAKAVTKPVSQGAAKQKPVSGGCAHCGGPVPKPERGPAAKYCKPAHRLAAHRAKKKVVA